MEIKIELDLPQIISSAVSAERIQPIVDKAITEAIKDAIGSATGYRSKFREELTRQVEEVIPHGLAIDDCAKFQNIINEAVTNAVHGANADIINTALKKAAKAVIPDVPSRIKLSEIVAEARDGFHKEKHEAFYAKYEPSEYGGGRLYLDDDESKQDRYRADFCISFGKDGFVYALRMDGANITPQSRPTVIGRFEGLLMSMYVGRTSIEIDCDESDVESAAAEQYD